MVRFVRRFVVVGIGMVLFFKQKTAYEMRISDWSSDVCSSDLGAWDHLGLVVGVAIREANAVRVMAFAHGVEHEDRAGDGEARLDHRAKLGDGVALAADDTGEIGEDGVEGTRVRVTTEEAGCLGGQLQRAVWHDGMYLTRTD